MPSPRALSVDCLERRSDLELLAAVVGDGAAARRSAAQLLGEADLGRLSRRGERALGRELGERAARRLAAAFELGRRVSVEIACRERALFGNFDDVARWGESRLAGLEHEEVWVLALDGRNGLRAALPIARGGLHGCALTPRDVLRPALAEAASAIVLVHNHPSGDPSPSPEDVHMTRALATACTAVSVPLLDHVVVARGGATSLVRLGVLPA